MKELVKISYESYVVLNKRVVMTPKRMALWGGP